MSMFFSVDGLDDPVRIKERISNLLTATVSSEGILERDGLVGTHSLQKMAVTFARKQGMTKASCVFVFFTQI
jgi:hypothetical protein